MKQWIFRGAALLVLLAGIGLMAYPMVSNLMYEKQQNNLAEYYAKAVREQPEEELSLQWEECYAYNRDLLDGGVLLTDPFDESQMDPTTMPYAGLLNLQGDGAMGVIEIPGITGNLIIYHGTGEDVLQKGVGHLQGSSLPVGGTGSHSVLSAHSGLPDKELFTNLDQMEIGDVFYIHVIDDVLAYQVDQINIVLPHETAPLMINAEEDYVTLVTCTPYGINSHRLLVRGARISYDEAKKLEAQQKSPLINTWQQQYVKALIVGLVIAAAAALFITARRLLRRRRNKNLYK